MRQALTAHQVEPEGICVNRQRSYRVQTGYDHTQVWSVAGSSNCGHRCCRLVNESVIAGFSQPQGGGQTDGRGRYQDNILVERLRRTVKYEEVYLKTYAKGLEARIGLREYFRFYNHPRPHQALAYRTQAEVFYVEPVVEELKERRCSDQPVLVSYEQAQESHLTVAFILSK